MRCVWSCFSCPWLAWSCVGLPSSNQAVFCPAYCLSQQCGFDGMLMLSKQTRTVVLSNQQFALFQQYHSIAFCSSRCRLWCCVAEDVCKLGFPVLINCTGRHLYSREVHSTFKDASTWMLQQYMHMCMPVQQKTPRAWVYHPALVTSSDYCFDCHRAAVPTDHDHEF